MTTLTDSWAWGRRRKRWRRSCGRPRPAGDVSTATGRTVLLVSPTRNSDSGKAFPGAPVPARRPLHPDSRRARRPHRRSSSPRAQRRAEERSGYSHLMYTGSAASPRRHPLRTDYHQRWGGNCCVGGGCVRKDGVSSSLVSCPASSLALMYSSRLTRPPHKHRPRLTPDIPPGANCPSRRSSPYSCPALATAPPASVPPFAGATPCCCTCTRPPPPRLGHARRQPPAAPESPLALELAEWEERGGRGRGRCPNCTHPCPGRAAPPPRPRPLHIVPRLQTAVAPPAAPRCRSLLTQLRINHAPILAAPPATLSPPAAPVVPLHGVPLHGVFLPRWYCVARGRVGLARSPPPLPPGSAVPARPRQISRLIGRAGAQPRPGRARNVATGA